MFLRCHLLKMDLRTSDRMTGNIAEELMIFFCGNAIQPEEALLSPSRSDDALLDGSAITTLGCYYTLGGNGRWLRTGNLKQSCGQCFHLCGFFHNVWNFQNSNFFVWKCRFFFL